MKFEDFLQELQNTKQLTDGTLKNYEITLKQYTCFHKLSLEELLEEAEEEEENRIRMRKRKISKRLLDFQNHLKKINTFHHAEYNNSTINKKISTLKSFYRFYDIEIPNIAPLKIIKTENIDDLITKKEIKQVIDNLGNMKHKAIILLAMSSGMSIEEITNLTCDDFVKATKEYHDYENINDIIPYLLKNDEPIIPTFYLTRKKTNYPYYCFCSPEASKYILFYLNTEKNLNNKSKLFNISKIGINKFFKRINDKEKFGTVNGMIKFHPHGLRKFFATTLISTMAIDSLIIEWLLGHRVGGTIEAYYKTNPLELKKAYLKVVDYLSISTVDVYTYTDKEVQNMKKSMDELIERVNKLEH